MLKRYLLICLLGTLPTLTSMAAEEAKPAAAPLAATSAKPDEVAPKADEAKNTTLARKRARWNKPGLDLTHCLGRTTNAEIIRCVE